MLTHAADMLHIARRLAGVGTLVSSLLACTGAMAMAQTAGFVDEDGKHVLSVPAELVRSLRLPGEGDTMQRPKGLFMDRTHGEIFVGDSGNNRIVVFDREGLYRFEFDCADHVSMPGHVVVDSEGFVRVLGRDRDGAKIVRFDFDGIYVSEIRLDVPDAGRWADMVIDEADRLFLLDERGQVHVLGRDGSVASRIDVTASFEASERRELVLGSITVHEGELYVPVSTFGRVLVFDFATGRELRRIGRRGTLPGELSFAASVAVLPSGMVTVLDKMRFAVVCYAPSGEFLGEFGGKGFRDGWFYHPSLLVSAGDDRVIVGQILDARVQLCRIPFFVQQNLMQLSGASGRDVGMEESEGRVDTSAADAGETVQEVVVR